ncbi:MAG: glucose-6-phosphate dehydrogenase assembly protein OpcA [Chloroflexi bacterium]|nr:glucose-6-phosphate dehydrogenase assembly protein OpcA [Chloroflexota bacterium]
MTKPKPPLKCSSDLPIVLWWPRPPFKRDDFARLAADADRLILDSASMGRAGLIALGEYIESSRKTRTSVSDLNWSRLTPYRQLFAQFFDAAKHRALLNNIEKVTIEAQEEAGLLMAGWLFSRLGDDCPMSKVELKVADSDGPALRSLTMKCAGGEFAVARLSPESVEARAAVDGESVARTARIDLAPLERLLAEEISYLGRDRAFDATMKWVTMAALMF